MEAKNRVIQFKDRISLIMFLACLGWGLSKKCLDLSEPENKDFSLMIPNNNEKVERLVKQYDSKIVKI